jgi:RimJ/RimL family protein N-acetyltransferase
MAEPPEPLLTPRLEVRHPTEADRARFVELFGDREFMVYNGVATSEEAAHQRFDRMLERCRELRFAKQPVVERSSGVVVGYTGVDRLAFEAGEWLEWGYRLVPAARGRGYATEASAALLGLVPDRYRGEILGIIHPDNGPSHKVIRKLGFRYWRRGPVLGDERDLYRWRPPGPEGTTTSEAR